MAEKLKPKVDTIDFVDIGFEDAVRLMELSGKSRHAGKLFVGIECRALQGLSLQILPILSFAGAGLLRS